MNVRERFRAICNFEKPDRLPRHETWGFWRETLQRWAGEGLPDSIVENEDRAFRYFGCDPLNWIPTSFGTDEPGFWPPFETEVIEETDSFIIKKDISGNTVKEFTDGRSTIPQYLESPVKTINDFEDLKPRLDPETSDRLTLLIDPMIELTQADESCLTGIYTTGLFGMYRHLMGLVGLSVSLKKNPGLLHAIAAHWVHFTGTLISQIREKQEVDFVLFWEDMAYKNGPMISPQAFRQFMSPYYKQVIEYVKDDTDIEVYCVDSDGDVTLLIPLFIEAGINMMLPFEVNAGMDVRTVREQHPDLIILGGIDKRALFSDEKSIRQEVMKIVPPMLEKGGYFPCLDHNVPPEVSLKNFETYLEIIRGLS